MYAIRTDQHIAADFGFAFQVPNTGYNMHFIVGVALNLAAERDATITAAIYQSPEQLHLQLTAMHGVLGPIVARMAPARFRPDLDARSRIEAVVCGLNADALQHVFQTKRVKFTHGWWLEIYPNTKGFGSAYAFEDMKRYTDLMQREPHGQSSNTTSGDENSHERLGIFVTDVFADRMRIVENRH